MHTYQAGDLRIRTFCEDRGMAAHDTERPLLGVDRDARLLDHCKAALEMAPPFTTATVEEYRGPWNGGGWRTLVSARSLPAPGWAAKSACYCRTCGCVAFDGAEPACAHGTPSPRR